VQPRIIRPKLIDDVLVNPNMGVTTFQRFNGDAVNPKGKWWGLWGPEVFPYANDPRINMVDVGMFGHWGEWHRMDGRMGSEALWLKGIELFLEAWPRTPKAMLIDSRAPTAFACQRGCGWRADCWGDLSGSGSTWNHMHDCYPQFLAQPEIRKAWGRGPVSLEVCWDMDKWHEEGWDIDYIINQALRWQFQPVPDGESVPQNCGIEHGSRTVSGTVVATEPAAMAWVKKQHALPFPTGTGGGGAPAIRYESPPRIQRSWEFLPITDGSARGSGSNATFVRVSFTFQETLLAFPYVEV
jgi:hypothetical protein